MANNENDDRLLNFSPMSDQDVLANWTVDDLDMLHAISGLGKEWMASDRRAELKKVEDEEMDRVQNIAMGIMPKEDEGE